MDGPKGLAWVLLSHALYTLYTLEIEDFGLFHKYGNMGSKVFKEGLQKNQHTQRKSFYE